MKIDAWLYLYLVVDDHQMFIEGIVAMFTEDKEIDVIDGCANVGQYWNNLNR